MSAFYRATFREFLQANPSEILNELHRQYAADFAQFQTAQHGAWEVQLPALLNALRAISGSQTQALDWGLLLEYSIPGRRKRLDCVILTGSAIVPIEFKV